MFFCELAEVETLIGEVVDDCWVSDFLARRWNCAHLISTAGLQAISGATAGFRLLCTSHWDC